MTCLDEVGRPVRHCLIIGAGVAGLTLSYRLLQKGNRVTVIEKSPFVGGQLATTELGNTVIEHYYHHAFTSDDALIALCSELGISERLMWLPSTMGYFSKGKMYPFGTPKSILTFRPLGIFAKVGFVLSTLWITFFMKQRYAEAHTVKAWFLKHGFSAVWETIWKPLFHLKFAADADRISLIWLWGKLHTRGTSRKGSKEVLAYMRGSFGHLAISLRAAIEDLGGVFLLETPIHSVVVDTQSNALGAASFTVTHASGNLCADVVVSTQASNQLLQSRAWSPETSAYLSSLTYKSAICVMVVGDQAWFDHYWINVGDASLPFGGIIEHTNWVSPKEYGGKHVLYLSRYLDEEDPLFCQSDLEITTLFCQGLRTVLPTFEREKVSDIRVFRQRNAQPVVPKGYVAPSMMTETPGFYWISTHHTYPSDRGINYAIRLANDLARDIA